MELLIALGCLAVGAAAGFGYGRMRGAQADIAARENVATLRAQLDEASRRISERDQNEERMLAAFEKLSRETLQQTKQSLVESAENQLKQAQLAAKGDLDQKQLKIETLGLSIRDELEKLEAFVQKTNSERKQEFGGIHEQLKQVAMTNSQIQSEAAQLKNVLRSSSAVRGRWGEVQLRRIVELAGMLEYCDFSEQESTRFDDSVGRPDLLISLPGNVKIAVDAKVPYEAFERGVSTEDAEIQKQHFAEHAKQLKVAVDGLAKRRYWEKVERSPGFCILFVPGEGLLQTALAHDPMLWEQAAEKKVLLASPQTLIAMLRMSAMTWQQQLQADNAQEISKAGRDLHARLVKVFEHLDKLGRSISNTNKQFNDVIGSMTTRVVPSTRKLRELGVAAEEMPELKSVEEIPRTFKTEEIIELDEVDQPRPLAEPMKIDFEQKNAG